MMAAESEKVRLWNAAARVNQIRAAFAADRGWPTGQVRVLPLWSRDGVSRYRVNVYGAAPAGAAVVRTLTQLDSAFIQTRDPEVSMDADGNQDVGEALRRPLAYAEVPAAGRAAVRVR